MSTSGAENRLVPLHRALCVATAIVPAPAPAAPTARWFTFYQRRQFFLKTALVAATTLAFVPILLYQAEGAALVAITLLIAAHFAGAAVIAYGVRRQQIAPDRRGMVSRLAAITVLVLLIWLAATGLTSPLSSGLFWGSLFAIWALHTVGLLLLHVRSRREQATCPFA